MSPVMRTTAVLRAASLYQFRLSRLVYPNPQPVLAYTAPTLAPFMRLNIRPPSRETRGQTPFADRPVRSPGNYSSIALRCSRTQIRKTVSLLQMTESGFPNERLMPRLRSTLSVSLRGVIPAADGP